MRDQNIILGAGILLVSLLSALAAAFLHSAKLQAFTFVFFSALMAGLTAMLLARKQYRRCLERLSWATARVAAGNVTGVPGESFYPGEYRDLIRELNNVSMLMRSIAENSQATAGNIFNRRAPALSQGFLFGKSRNRTARRVPASPCSRHSSQENIAINIMAPGKRLVNTGICYGCLKKNIKTLGHWRLLCV